MAVARWWQACDCASGPCPSRSRDTVLPSGRGSAAVGVLLPLPLRGEENLSFSTNTQMRSVTMFEGTCESHASNSFCCNRKFVGIPIPLH